MPITDSIAIDSDLETVWPFVANPVGLATWNQKIVSVYRTSDQPVREGEKFDMVFRKSGTEYDVHVQVVACQPWSHVHYRHFYAWKGKQRFADETYQIAMVGEQVRVLQTIDLSGTGIPWFFDRLIELIARFGKPVGQTSMENLKAMVEGHEPA